MIITWIGYKIGMLEVDLGIKVIFSDFFLVEWECFGLLSGQHGSGVAALVAIHCGKNHTYTVTLAARQKCSAGAFSSLAQ